MADGLEGLAACRQSSPSSYYELELLLMKKKNDPFFVKGKKQRDAREARLEKQRSYAKDRFDHRRLADLNYLRWKLRVNEAD
jgi:hypothetical protein